MVDDEPEIAKMLTVVLQMNLFNAMSFTDPAAALESARASPPDYVISDIVMPEMSGIDLAIAIRRDVPTCKVLLFSGHVDALELTQQAMGHSTAFSTSVSSPLAS